MIGLGKDKNVNKVDCFRGRRSEEAFAMMPPPSAPPSFRTSEPKSHFRFYASSIGRFMKPDNIIPNAFNPQSWNLYSYVNGNPVNFNDPLGHAGQGMAKPYYFANGGSASWLNWGVYNAFMGELYDGNLSFGGGFAGGGNSSSSQTYTYEVGKWVLAGFFSMCITEDQSPYSMTTFATQAIWSYQSYKVQCEIDFPTMGIEKGESVKSPITIRKENLWEKWLYNFNRTNEVIPGRLAPWGFGLITSGKISGLLETPTIGQWVVAGFRGVTAGGVQWTATETAMLAGGTYAVNFITVGMS